MTNNTTNEELNKKKKIFQKKMEILKAKRAVIIQKAVARSKVKKQKTNDK